MLKHKQDHLRAYFPTRKDDSGRLRRSGKHIRMDVKYISRRQSGSG